MALKWLDGFLARRANKNRREMLEWRRGARTASDSRAIVRRRRDPRDKRRWAEVEYVARRSEAGSRRKMRFLQRLRLLFNSDLRRKAREK